MPEGIGKSAYCNHALADGLGYQACKDKGLTQWMWKRADEKPKDLEVWPSDWDKARGFIKYPPDEVVDFCLEMVEHEFKEIAFHWDDAGTWLNAMDFQDPFVVAFMKYMSLARSNWGGIILSTPVEEWVLKKLRTARGIYHIEIKRKPGTDRRYKFRPRVANCYKARKYKGNPKVYWPRKWTDDFPAIMPDSFFSWYEPQRRRYTKLAVQMMKRALDGRKQRGWIKKVEVDETVLENMDERIAKANDKSVDFSEALDHVPTLA